MEANEGTSEKLLEDMRSRKVDVDLTLRVLRRINEGRYSSEAVEFSEIPTIDGQSIIDMESAPSWRMPLPEAESRLEELALAGEKETPYTEEAGSAVFDFDKLTAIGLRLLPKVSLGILNGGSATSYADTTKNESFDSDLFGLYRAEFEALAPALRGRPKGLTAAFVNPDGSPGPSYIELKMRGQLLRALVAGADSKAAPTVLHPMFQMTSVSNDSEVRDCYESYRASPLLAELVAATGIQITEVATGVQALIAAFTHSSEGAPRRVFDGAFGHRNECLPLPGGHGQSFAVLREVFEDLLRRGKRYVQLSNVDNLASTVDPVEVAILALSGKQAGFDFARRTPVDVKGGVLVKQKSGGFTCADIGPAISKTEVLEAERAGKPVLFNCATGLFDLTYLLERIDRIVDQLPLRVSDQEKDAGRYSQAEQITWEVMGLLDDVVVFAVDKYDRFLAAKLLVESMLTSGLHLTEEEFPKDREPKENLLFLGQRLHQGLMKKLKREYGMRMERGRWVPIPLGELREKGD